MSSDDRIPIRNQSLPDEVVSARERQHEADAANEAIVTARIEAHLHVMAAVLDTLRDQHKRVVEETDFEPLEKTRQSAAWLIAGRCISLGYEIVVCLRAGVTTDVAPLVRTLHEANGALRIMMNADETKLHRKWLRDGYFSANDLRLAQKRIEDSAAVEMLMRGVAPQDAPTSWTASSTASGRVLHTTVGQAFWKATRQHSESSPTGLIQTPYSAGYGQGTAPMSCTR